MMNSFQGSVRSPKSRNNLLFTMKPKQYTSPELEVIFKKYGDIAKDCVVECEDLRTLMLQKIAKIIAEIKRQISSGSQFNTIQFKAWYATPNEAERVKIDVKWLRVLLDKVPDYVYVFLLKERTAKLNSDIELKKVEMTKLKSEIELMKMEMGKLNSDIETHLK